MWNTGIVIQFHEKKYIIWALVCVIQTYSRPENLKKSRPKKLVKSNKSISQKKNFFYKNPFFVVSKKLPKFNFWTGKKFKTAKNAISWETFFDFTTFLSGLISIF